MHDLDRTLRTYELETGESNLFESGNAELIQEIWGEDAMHGEASYGDREIDQLAQELLSVSGEEELDQFLGGLLRKAGSFARRLAPILKPLAKKVLPIAAGAVGTFFGGPVGGALGSKLGSMATNLFEVNLEGLEPEEQQMEVARNFVRFASAAADEAATAPRTADPNRVVRSAITAAARAHAPGLLRKPVGGGACASAKSGRWVRSGGNIVVKGL